MSRAAIRWISGPVLRAVARLRRDYDVAYERTCALLELRELLAQREVDHVHIL